MSYLLYFQLIRDLLRVLECFSLRKTRLNPLGFGGSYEWIRSFVVRLFELIWYFCIVYFIYVNSLLKARYFNVSTALKLNLFFVNASNESHGVDSILQKTSMLLLRLSVCLILTTLKSRTRIFHTHKIVYDCVHIWIHVREPTAKAAFTRHTIHEIDGIDDGDEEEKIRIMHRISRLFDALSDTCSSPIEMPYSIYVVYANVNVPNNPHACSCRTHIYTLMLAISGVYGSHFYSCKHYFVKIYGNERRRKKNIRNVPKSHTHFLFPPSISCSVRHGSMITEYFMVQCSYLWQIILVRTQVKCLT